MVNIDVIKKRLNQLSASLNKMERFKDISLEEFLNIGKEELLWH